MPGAGKQGQFDRLYKDTSTGEWKVVECKRGESPLKGRQGTGGINQQGTKAYIDSIIENLSNNPNFPNSKLDDLNDLRNALNSTPIKLKSYVFRQQFDDVGNLKPSKIAEVQF